MVGSTFILSILASLVAASSAFSVGVKPAWEISYRAHLPAVRTAHRTVVFAALASTRKEGKGAKAGGGFAAGGFGKKSSGKSAPTVDAATLLRQSMDLYDRLCASSGSVPTSDVEGDDAEMSELREYVVCVRHSGEAQVFRAAPIGWCAGRQLTRARRAAERLGAGGLRRAEVARRITCKQPPAQGRRRSPPCHARRCPPAAPRDLGVRHPGSAL
jgi:hypothetical protein